MTTSAPVRICPNCRARVPAGQVACGTCKLEVRAMDKFAAAKRAAMKTIVQEEPKKRRIHIDPKFVALLVVVLVIGGLIFYFTRPNPPRYLKFPATAEAAAREFMTHISTGDDLRYDQAYGMIADSARDSKDDDERGHYRGLFHAIYKYLTGEFGSGWIENATFAADPADQSVLLVKVGPETLHLRYAQQTPAEKMGKQGAHYGIIGLDEFDVREASAYQSEEAQLGAVRGLAGEAAVNNIKTILGATGRRNERPMAKKIRLLATLRNPAALTRRAVIMTWPLRTDPVMRARLEMVSQNGRFDAEIQKIARDVLNNAVSEEDLIAAGVDN